MTPTPEELDAELARVFALPFEEALYELVVLTNKTQEAQSHVARSEAFETWARKHEADFGYSKQQTREESLTAILRVADIVRSGLLAAGMPTDIHDASTEKKREELAKLRANHIRCQIR